MEISASEVAGVLSDLCSNGFSDIWEAAVDPVATASELVLLHKATGWGACVEVDGEEEGGPTNEEEDEENDKVLAPAVTRDWSWEERDCSPGDGML